MWSDTDRTLEQVGISLFRVCWAGRLAFLPTLLHASRASTGSLSRALATQRRGYSTATPEIDQRWVYPDLLLTSVLAPTTPLSLYSARTRALRRRSLAPRWVEFVTLHTSCSWKATADIFVLQRSVANSLVTGSGTATAGVRFLRLPERRIAP